MVKRRPLSELRLKVKTSLRGKRKPPDATASDDAPDDNEATGGIDIDYRPERDGDADPGEVVWAWVPYEDDPTDGKDRPVLVLGIDDGRLVAVPMSSKDHGQRRDAHEWIEVGRGGWDREGRVSYADASRLLRYLPNEVRREGAALDETRFRAVVERVAKIHGWTAR